MSTQRPCLLRPSTIRAARTARASRVELVAAQLDAQNRAAIALASVFVDEAVASAGAQHGDGRWRSLGRTVVWRWRALAKVEVWKSTSGRLTVHCVAIGAVRVADSALDDIDRQLDPERAEPFKRVDLLPVIQTIARQPDAWEKSSSTSGSRSSRRRGHRDRRRLPLGKLTDPSQLPPSDLTVRF